MNTIENTIFIGKVLKHFTEISSTNTFASEWVSKNKPTEGTVISTYNQLNGRGQIGRNWQSEPFRNIAASIVLYPSFLPAKKQFSLNQAVSLGVYDLVARYAGEKTSIKWPNDIYVENRKVAGILIQNSLSGSHIQSSVAGVGLNVNQQDFPDDLPNPVSLCQITGRAIELDDLLASLCQCIERRYLQLKGGATGTINKEYQDRMFRLAEKSCFKRADGTIFSGEITGVEESGKLLIASEKGVEAFVMQTIQFII